MTQNEPHKKAIGQVYHLPVILIAVGLILSIGGLFYFFLKGQTPAPQTVSEQAYDLPRDTDVPVEAKTDIDLKGRVRVSLGTKEIFIPEAMIPQDVAFAAIQENVSLRVEAFPDFRLVLVEATGRDQLESYARLLKNVGQLERVDDAAQKGSLYQTPDNMAALHIWGDADNQPELLVYYEYVDADKTAIKSSNLAFEQEDLLVRLIGTDPIEDPFAVKETLTNIVNTLTIVE